MPSVLSGPIAIVSNVFRIFLLCLVGYFWGSEVAAGRFHDVSGYLIFVVAFILFFGLEALLRRWAPALSDEKVRPDSQGDERVGMTSTWRPGVMIVAGLAVVGAAHLAILAGQARAARNAAPMESLQIPDRIVDYTQMGSDLKADERTQEVLATSSILMRTYAAPSGRPVSLTIVYAGTTRRSLHFPEVCLVGEGWEVHEQQMMPVGFLFSAKRLVLVRGEREEAVLYWFKTGDALTGNYFLNAYYWAKNQLLFKTPTSSMIRVSTPVLSDGVESAFAVLEDFATKFTPVLLEHVD